MHDHTTDQLIQETKKKKLVLVGHPNIGKSVLFRNLTGKYAMVSNYPGTTVEITTGYLNQSDKRSYQIVDTPGINSFISSSDDERITKNILLDGNPDIIVQIGDMKNLRRTLHLTFQILSLKNNIPFILILNMADEAEKRGIEVNIQKLHSFLRIPVIRAVATQNIGTKALLKEIEKIHSNKGDSIDSINVITHYHTLIEKSLDEIQILLENKVENPRGWAELLLRGDNEIFNFLLNTLQGEITTKISKIVQETKNSFNDSLTVVMAKQIDIEILKIIGECERNDSSNIQTVSEKLDRFLLNPITGTPLFIMTLILVFLFVGVFGAGELVDFVESVIFAKYINPVAIDFFNWIPIPIIKVFLVGDFGIITFGITYAIAIVFPVVTSFFITFAILEDSGYLSRLAFLADRLFRKIGLNGKAVLPLVLGTGCGTMATMTTRILETRKERLIATLALALGIPCSAQLAVIFGILTYISPLGMLIVFGVVFSQLLLVTYISSKFISGDKSDFIIELPPLRSPVFRNVLIKTWARVEWFLKEAIPLFIFGTIFINFLDIFTLIEIIHYMIFFMFVFILWKNFLRNYRDSVSLSHWRISTYGIILPSSFLFLYYSHIPDLTTNLISLFFPNLIFIINQSFLEIILEISKPIIVNLLNLPPQSAIMFILGFLRRDYGAAGFFDLATQGLITGNQIVVGIIVLTLFIPCVANLFVIAKEYGSKIAFLMVAFLTPYAILIGTIVNFFILIGGISL